MVFYRAFEHGLGAGLGRRDHAPAQHAFYLTVIVTLIAVPLNTVFGVADALAARAPRRSAASALLDALIDLPFAVSPVVVGLALILV